MASYISQANQLFRGIFFQLDPRESDLLCWQKSNDEFCKTLVTRFPTIWKKPLAVKKEWSQFTRKQRQEMTNTQWARKFLVPAAPETSGILVLVVGGLAVQPSPGFHKSEPSFLCHLLWVGFAPWQLESHEKMQWWGKEQLYITAASRGSSAHLWPAPVTYAQTGLCLLHDQEPTSPHF